MIPLARPLADITRARSVILHGSLAAGGFRPGESDLDLLVIVDAPLTDPQITAIERLARHADLRPSAGLDLHVVTTAVARAPTPAPPLELQIGHPWEISVRQPQAPDLPAELSMARADGRALIGDGPHDVLAPIPRDWIVARGRHWLRTWLTLTDDAEHAAFMLQTACRIWHFATTGAHCSKQDAVTWAYSRDPSLSRAGLGHLLETVLEKTA